MKLKNRIDDDDGRCANHGFISHEEGDRAIILEIDKGPGSNFKAGLLAAVLNNGTCQ